MHKQIIASVALFAAAAVAQETADVIAPTSVVSGVEVASTDVAAGSSTEVPIASGSIGDDSNATASPTATGTDIDDDDAEITGIPSIFPTTLGPPSCMTALANIYMGAPGCENIDLGDEDSTEDIFANTKLAPGIANCICYTSGKYAPSHVDGILSTCYSDIVASWTSEAIPSAALGFCKRIGDVKATATGTDAKATGGTASTGKGGKGSSGGDSTDDATGAADRTASSTDSAASASGTNAAPNMKVDWIVMGSASLLALVSAAAAML